MFRTISKQLLFLYNGEKCFYRLCMAPYCVRPHGFSKFSSNFQSHLRTFVTASKLKNCPKSPFGEHVNNKSEETTEIDSNYDGIQLSDVPVMDSVSNFEKFKHLAETEELREHLKHVLMEYDYLKYVGERVPSHLTDDAIKELLTLKTRSQRSKFLKYLRKIELVELSEQKKKEARKALRQAKADELKNKSDWYYTYGIWNNSMFIRISDAHMNRFYYWRQANGVMFGQSIVFDFGFDEFMQKRECVNAADQVLMAYGHNKVDLDPNYLHFCNASESNLTLQQVYKAFPNKYGFINITEKSYLDIFPKEQLVYLTPDAQTTLTKYDPEAVYIIGVYVDKSIPKPVSLAKAKAEGIRMAKLPIEEHVLWKQGSRSLTIDQVYRILLEVKNTKDWNKAFKFLPSRKVFGTKTDFQKKLEISLPQTNKRQRKGLFSLKDVLRKEM